MVFRHDESLTAEQMAISSALLKTKNHNSAFLVNAGAGTGKTYSVKAICANYIIQNPNTKILYLVFNRTMADYFKKITEWTDVCFSPSDIRSLSDFVDVKTYHSFLKDDGGLAAGLLESKINHNEALINYAKGSLNNKDIAIISHYFTNLLVNNKLLDMAVNLDNYSKKIQPEIEKYFNSYFKSAYSCRSILDNISTIKESNVDLDIVFANINKENLAKLLQNHAQIKSGAILVAVYLNISLNKAIQDKQIEVCHDFYYKRAYESLRHSDKLLRTKLDGYSMTIIDEAQDADEMIFTLMRKRLSLNATPFHFIAFGDPKQSIYKFKGAFNIFKWANEPQNQNLFVNFGLTHSFRYGDKIANFGEKIAKAYFPNDKLIGNDNIKDEIANDIKSTEQLARYILDNSENLRLARKERDKMAVIFRTNTGCIECLSEIREEVATLLETPEYQHLKNSFAPEHIALESKIKKDLKDLSKKDFLSLIDNQNLLPRIYSAYADSLGVEPWKVKDLKLSVADVCKNQNIRNLIQNHKSFADYLYLLKPSDTISKILARKEKGNACVIITNVHQSKGKEYQRVVLGDDFLARKNEYYCNEEEINIAHTAITRARKELMFYESKNKNNLLNYFYNKNESPSEQSQIDINLKQVNFNNNFNDITTTHEYIDQRDLLINDDTVVTNERDSKSINCSLDELKLSLKM